LRRSVGANALWRCKNKETDDALMKVVGRGALAAYAELAIVVTTRVLLRRFGRIAALLTMPALAPTPVFAHYEAIFGPQSSAVLSAGRFVSAQVFTRDTGPDRDRRRLQQLFSVPGCSRSNARYPWQSSCQCHSSAARQPSAPVPVSKTR
jgi:hypothetical protein